MKTTINPATIVLEIQELRILLSLQEAKELAALLNTEIQAIEGPPQTTTPELDKDSIKKTLEDWKRQYERDWDKVYPPIQPHPYYPPNPTIPTYPSFPQVWCNSKTHE